MALAQHHIDQQSRRPGNKLIHYSHLILDKCAKKHAGEKTASLCHQDEEKICRMGEYLYQLFI
jgi:hypothetical protein